MNKPDDRWFRDEVLRLVRIHWPALALAVVIVAGYADLKRDLAAAGAGMVEADSETPEVMSGIHASKLQASQAVEKGLEPESLPAEPVEDWNCKDHIPRKSVEDAIGEYGYLVFDCYKKTLAKKPDLGGRMTIQFNVGGLGEIREARVLGPIQDTELLGCINESIFDWAFHPPLGGNCAIVSVPFDLDPDAVATAAAVP